MAFVHLQVQSGYSLLSSAVKINELVQQAKKLNYSSLALTDENVMYGTVSFYQSCRREGIKPIIGLTLSILEDDECDAVSFPFVFLAKNNTGYQNLLKMSSLVQTKAKTGLKQKWLLRYSEGLIVLTPGKKGLIERYIIDDRIQEAEKAIRFFQKTYGEENVYLSIQRHGTEEQELNQKMIPLARKWGVPLVAANDVRYLKKGQSFAHDCLLAIKQGAKLEELDKETYRTQEYYLKSPREMTDLFADFPEVLEQTISISERCNVNLPLGEAFLPKYPTPEGITADEYLVQLCEKGLREKIQGQKDISTYKERLRYELSVIQQMKFSDYFLIVWDFMNYAHRQGIMTGPGRGSAAGSLVAYVLNITAIDPLEYDLLFERFLNPERVSMPDIDIDFPDHRRDEVIRYVAKKYGEFHVAQIITFGTLAAKAAIRDVGRVLGMDGKEVDKVSKLISNKAGITLKQAYEQSESLRIHLQQSKERQRLFEAAMGIEGLPRHTSTHAAGVVISERPLMDLVAIQEGHEGVYLTQIDMEGLEAVGLLKMDFLGLRNLSILDKVVHHIQKETGQRLQLNNLTLKDERTYSLLAKGDTTGIFQLESEGMRRVLQQLKPTELEDIVAVNALYRPGPMENIPLYIERKHGKNPIHYLHSDLEGILRKTYGVIVYQEQIMQIASKMAGFTLGEADLLRRAVSKKKREVLDEQRARFVNGCMQNGYNEQLAQSLYDLIVRFADYGFNRSHAVAYSMIAYQLAYLKANYPLYFFSALLTSVIGNEGKMAQYIHEARSKAIKILSPSINESMYEFKVEKEGIRFSLAAIKHVGAMALKEIFRARRQRHFTDLFDFCMRVSMKIVNRRTLESLITSGSFDEFGEDRATLLASIDVALEHIELIGVDDQENFFLDEEFSLKPKYVTAGPMPLAEKLQLEKEALGFYLTSHPAMLFRSAFSSYGAKTIYEVLVNQRVSKVAIGVFLSSEKVIRTKNGELMAFFTASDETGEVRAVAFPRVYQPHQTLLTQGEVLLLQGKVERREGQLQFVIQEAKKVPNSQELAQEAANVLYLKIEEQHKYRGCLPHIQHILASHKGNVPVIMYYEDEKRTVKLPEMYNVHPASECLKQLTDVLGEGNVVLKEL
ncbi:DNA polymerase III subunit alpha [Bacillus songklensis]|uniref:DNA polymerase III subunit alpha n=1 Tax=Bacillus songklensis TaxID=1069116 RepID=A0ABV8B0R7_9BACI